MDCTKLKGILSKHGLSIVPFADWHLEHFDYAAGSGGLAGYIADYATYIRSQAVFGTTWSVIRVNGGCQVAGVFGVVELWPGVGEFWSIPGTIARKNPVSFVKASRLILDEIEECGGFWRLQAYVRAPSKKAVQFAKACYFVPEAELSRFGPDGSDYFIFARFPDGWTVLETERAADSERSH